MVLQTDAQLRVALTSDRSGYSVFHFMSTILLYVEKGEERLLRTCRHGQKRNACSVCLLQAAGPLVPVAMLVKGTTLLRSSLAEDFLRLSSVLQLLQVQPPRS